MCGHAVWFKRAWVVLTLVAVFALPAASAATQYYYDTPGFGWAGGNAIFRFHYEWADEAYDPWTKSAQWTWLLGMYDWGANFHLADYCWWFAEYTLGWYNTNGPIDVYFSTDSSIVGGALAVTQCWSNGDSDIYMNLNEMPDLFFFDGFGMWGPVYRWSSTWADDMGEWSSVLCHETVHAIHNIHTHSVFLDGNPWLTEALAWYAGSLYWPMYDWNSSTGWSAQFTLQEARDEFIRASGAINTIGSWTWYGSEYLKINSSTSWDRFSAVTKGLMLIGAYFHEEYFARSEYPGFTFTNRYVQTLLGYYPTTNAAVNSALQKMWSTSYTVIDVTGISHDHGGLWEDWHYMIYGHYW